MRNCERSRESRREGRWKNGRKLAESLSRKQEDQAATDELGVSWKSKQEDQGSHSSRTAVFTRTVAHSVTAAKGSPGSAEYLFCWQRWTHSLMRRCGGTHAPMPASDKSRASRSHGSTVFAKVEGSRWEKGREKKKRQMLLANDRHTWAAEWLWLLEGPLTALSTLSDPAKLVSASAVPRSSFRQRQHHSFLACAGRGKLYSFLTAGEYLPSLLPWSSWTIPRLSMARNTLPAVLEGSQLLNARHHACRVIHPSSPRSLASLREHYLRSQTARIVRPRSTSRDQWIAHPTFHRAISLRRCIRLHQIQCIATRHYSSSTGFLPRSSCVPHAGVSCNATRLLDGSNPWSMAHSEPFWKHTTYRTARTYRFALQHDHYSY